MSISMSVVDTLDPSSVTVTSTARAMRPSIMAYSARSCPDSSFQRLISLFIVATVSFGKIGCGPYGHPRSNVASMTDGEALGVPNGQFIPDLVIRACIHCNGARRSEDVVTTQNVVPLLGIRQIVPGERSQILPVSGSRDRVAEWQAGAAHTTSTRND